MQTINLPLKFLHGKKYLPVVDTAKGHLHVETDYESSLLWTLNTPLGRYRFKSLPFGVILSQDTFWHKFDEVYKELIQKQILQAIHLGHQGETKFILLARESALWLGISSNIHQMVKDSNLCKTSASSTNITHYVAWSPLQTMEEDWYRCIWL